MPRVFPIAFLLTFLLCYLEWGGGNSGFLLQMEYDVLFKGHISNSFKHPLVLIPFLGQLLLIIAVFRPRKKLVLTGLILQGTLVLMILLVGCLSLNVKIFVSTLPFVLLLVLFIRYSPRPKKNIKQ